MPNQGPDDENDVLCFLIFVRLFFLLHVLLPESERCPAYNDRQDDDDAQLHLTISSKFRNGLLLDV